MTGRRTLSGDVALSLLLGAVGVYWMFASVRYGFWQGFGPRPGFLPFAYGALLAALSGAVLVRSVRDGSSATAAAGESVYKPLLIALIIALTLVGMKLVGFVIAIFTALLAMFVAVERLAVLRSVLVAAATTAIFHFLLAVWLRVPLPDGPLGF